MAEITTRDLGDTAKGSALTNAEMDTNFINLNQGLEQAAADLEDATIASDAALKKLKMQVMLDLI